MKTVISPFILILTLLLTTAFRGDDRLKFYWGEKEIEYKSGLSLAEINQTYSTSKLRFKIREDLIQEVGYRNTKIEINLVRKGASIYTYRFDDALSHQTLKIDRIFTSLREEDTILIQFKGVKGVLPQIIGLKIRE
ncbi:hypothetical protein [Reichenbachiella sp.]|uniref:hypothetical protein n=1 Tax=Reichenbachiella sp. TaxID=2184521 RepID=UPI003BAF18D6